MPPKKPIKKTQPKPKDNSLDYSHLYSSFYDIFVSHQTDPKQFDPQYVMRECRTIYASFVSLMEGSQMILLQNKVKFDANPLEKAFRDHKESKKSYLNIPEQFEMIGGSRDQQILIQA